MTRKGGHLWVQEDVDGDPRVGHMLTELPYNPGGRIQHLTDAFLLTATSEEVSGVQNGKLLKKILIDTCND